MNAMCRFVPWFSVCVVLLSACGGGGPSVSADSSQATSLSMAGTISGLGSVIVNGVRYETIGAAVVDADDSAVVTSPLGLGMTVDIDPLPDNHAAAATIRVQSGIKGPASEVNSATLSLTVAGLPVRADANTFIVNAAGLTGSFNSLADGQDMEVYGVPQSDGTFKATRIEIESRPQNVRLLGIVSNLNTSNSSFTLGTASRSVAVTYAGTTVPTGLANGVVVSVHTASTVATAPYAASSLYIRSASVSAFAQYISRYRGTSGIHNETNELYGVVSSLTVTVSGCSMQVQGVPTTLASATLCASIQNGDYVEVKGLFSEGALTAHRVEFKTAGQDRTLNGYQDDDNDSDRDELKYRRQLNRQHGGDDDDNATSSYEIYGTLSDCSGSTCRLTSHGSVLMADLSTAYWEHGQVSSGFVEAKGYMTSASDFKVLKIEAKH